ncbi:MAG: AraC family transcriptional regulator [Luteibacter sp.]|uniref:helix-turn-helix transcriptional regulator n=1 Tax=unclassified Luteibacter TaxID=2620188 RepID=UPI002807BA84|nr:MULTISPECIES: AraC family transcriptional regulator [unclassified Luteibacter]MDQ7996304.1 AraC family transcriptional regulator [Luteibacter sp.]MDQ8048068.1 AraC family transcriptional regulator [Luteibacter sp.]MDR6642864.1 AraC-like DNA-binding protein [Luteibacter sp. 1214]
MRFETEAFAGTASLRAVDPSVAHLLEQALTAVETDLATTRACVAQVAALLEREEKARPATRTVPADPVVRRRVGAGLAPWQARRVSAHVNDNLGFPITIDQLAGIAGLSSSYFCRAFKDTFGDPPHAYIMRRRVERAQSLMLQTREPLSQIALACGLSDQAHLCNLFRRLVGQSPSHWRRSRWQEA